MVTIQVVTRKQKWVNRAVNLGEQHTRPLSPALSGRSFGHRVVHVEPSPISPYGLPMTITRFGIRVVIIVDNRLSLLKDVQKVDARLLDASTAYIHAGHQRTVAGGRMLLARCHTCRRILEALKSHAKLDMAAPSRLAESLKHPSRWPIRIPCCNSPLPPSS